MPGNRVIAPDLIEDLPPSVAAILEEFVGTLLQAAGPRLDAVILFGSAAEGRLRSTSDVNLLVIAAGLTLQELDSVRLALHAGRSAAGLTVMFLEKSELANAMEAFAVKFTDIKARHRVLYGKSPLDSFEIPRDATLRRVRQVLLNLTVRLRERYVIDGDHEEQLARILADITGPIRASAATLIVLRDGRSLAPKEALEAIFARDGSWDVCLKGLSAVHRDQHLAPGATRQLFGEVLRLLVALDAIAYSLS
jgi:predicted nucleotidyltransferase